eukprot:SAG22_NODE_1360_length_4622_cov_2.212912_3_plen_78_part_00
MARFGGVYFLILTTAEDKARPLSTCFARPNAALCRVFEMSSGIQDRQQYYYSSDSVRCGFAPLAPLAPPRPTCLRAR